MQSGIEQTKFWKLEFVKDGKKWENPLMGWTSSSDPVQALELKFNTKEEAVAYSERQGWTYSLREPQKPILKLKNYASNFLYSKEKLKLIRTK